MANRLKVLMAGVFILGALIIGRLFELQVLGHNFYADSAHGRNAISQSIPAERGRIFLYDGDEFYPLSINVNTYNLIAVPAQISKPGEWAEKIAPFLGIEKSIILDQLIEESEDTDEFKELLERLAQKNDFYELLKRDLTINEVEQIKTLDLEGVVFETVPGRYWPEKNLFSHIVGFTGIQDNELKGQYGLEEFFDEELRGIPGQLAAERAPGGYLISSSQDIIKQPKDGVDLVLTIDQSIQFFACQSLRQAVIDYEAAGGSVMILAPDTGAILALCNQPDFNPNQYSKVKDFAIFKDSSISSPFEPGSIFKIITMAGALDDKKVMPTTIYHDKGYLNIDDYTIRNVDGQTYDWPTMTNVLEHSINTGAVFAARQLGRRSFRNYVKKFGFGGLTGIELAGEVSGNVDNLEERAEIYLATASFGQGITATSLQIINAVGAIANQGKLMKPYIIERIVEDNRESIQEPRFIRQVVSPSTATTLTAMLVSVLENGYGRQARVPGYFVAGKTGTAQVPGPGSTYSDKVIHSFVGFAPATDPKFVALVKLDNPQKGRFADSTAAPVFGKIAEFILRYYGVPPDNVNN